jgi:hypothetical protein
VRFVAVDVLRASDQVEHTVRSGAEESENAQRQQHRDELRIRAGGHRLAQVRPRMKFWLSDGLVGTDYTSVFSAQVSKFGPGGGSPITFSAS